MRRSNIIKINFQGGIISPGDLYEILLAAKKCGVPKVGFGLRQQLLLEVHVDDCSVLKRSLDNLGILYETDADEFPNIISSYPAEEVFITKTWLSEGVYKDIFYLLDYRPRLKVNISDSNQSFTPLLTGNINWVAAQAQHFWHVFIRFPKTNTVYEWNQLVYTNDVPRMSRHIEHLIFENPALFYDNPAAAGDQLFDMVQSGHYILQPAPGKAALPAFNLPYYEGLNRYNDKYWLGIYRRDEHFPIELLLDICRLCLDTKIGQLCSTPWKSLIIKGIEEKDRPRWNQLLSRRLINIRHAANELNFQVEDNNPRATALKQYLIRRFNRDDVRSFGLCIGIKTRKKTEVFSSILIRRRALLRVGSLNTFFVYDILCAKNYNPNERTSSIFSRGIPGFLLAGRLQKAVLNYYRYLDQKLSADLSGAQAEPEKPKPPHKKLFVYQCPHCRSIYDETAGDPPQHIPPGTAFSALPADYTCFLCETPVSQFAVVEKNALPV